MIGPEEDEIQVHDAASTRSSKDSTLIIKSARLSVLCNRYLVGCLLYGIAANRCDRLCYCIT
jgi:hypothetical protein